MAQIPIEAVIKIERISPHGQSCSVTFPPMSKEAALKFCEQMGWLFSYMPNLKLIRGYDKEGSRIMRGDQTNVIFYSR